MSVAAIDLERPSRAAESLPPAVDGFSDALILVIDDSALMRAMVAGYLRTQGLTNLLFAREGAEGLEIARRSRPELIITDLMMPGMDGFELCRQIRAHAETRDIPILVQTGMERAEERSKVFSAGASDLIMKPVDPREMVGRVKVHLERQRLIAQLQEYREMMARELDQAREMQESLLPDEMDTTRLMATYPMCLASTYQASIGLGGDIWGIHELGNRRIRIFTADFTGHGVSSALNTFRLHSYMQNAPAATEDPAAWLSYLNEFLYQALPTGQFATMFAGVIDFAAGTLRFACAATPPVLIRSPETGLFSLLDGSGFPLGIRRAAPYETFECGFGPGSALVLYSDALIETPDPPDQIFTPESLCAFLNGLPDIRRASDLHQALLDRLHADTNTRLTDDLTIVTLSHRTEGYLP